jgi:hypothetical protein
VIVGICFEVIPLFVCFGKHLSMTSSSMLLLLQFCLLFQFQTKT